MSKLLANLLGESEKSVEKAIVKLESLSGYQSEDVRLVLEMKEQTSKKIASLGLDPNDTTGQELYHALQAKLQTDVDHLVRALDLRSNDSIDTRANKLAKVSSHLLSGEKVLALRHPVAKELLRAHPPKKLMKKLNYRSPESLLKRHNLEEVFASAPAVEAKSWYKNMARDIAKLNASDFEERKISIITMSSKKWANASSQPITTAPLMAAIAIWPVSLLAKKEGILATLSILQAEEIIQTDDFYLQKHRFHSQFGKIISNLYEAGERAQFDEKNSLFDWDHIRHALEGYEQPLIKLARLHPSLAWWQDARALAFLDDSPVSLNLGDNVNSLFSGASFENRSSASFAHRLKSELLKRYAGYSTVKDYFSSAFDDTFIETRTAQPAYEFETVGVE